MPADTAPHAATPAEVQRLVDEAAIVRLTHDYSWALDTRQWDALRDIFTEDCEAKLAGRQHGVGEVIARVRSALEPLDGSQHMVSTHQITVSGDTATGRCHLQAQHIKNGTPGGDQFIVAGRYDDKYVRTPAGWRIAERVLVMAWTAGNIAVVS